MALPVGLPTVTIEFGPYSDLAGTVGYTGVQGFATAVHPETFEPVEVYLVASGQSITDRAVPFFVDAAGIGEVGPLVKPNTGQTTPDNFLISISFPAYGPAPKNRIVAIPPGAPDVVDYDELATAESQPVISVPLAASLEQVAAAITEAQADADAAAGASISAAASAAAAASSATSADTRAAAAEVAGDLVPYDTDLWTGTISLASNAAWSAPNTHIRTLTGDVTISSLPDPMAAGKSGTVTVVVKQAASGGPFTLAWPATLEWAGDAPAPSMPVVANAELIVHLFWTGLAWRARSGTYFP